jgi:putative tryptophan/tyrosine transport system substrate-binding protein
LDPTGQRRSVKELNIAAEALRLQLQRLEIQSAHAINSAFREATKGRAEAIVVLVNPVIISQRTQFLDLATKNRLPAVYSQPEIVDAGGLLSYTASFTDLFRRAAVYVDKILKGAKPADLPVEQPKKFEFIINLKTAKQIGLTIPPNVLARADKVIR